MGIAAAPSPCRSGARFRPEAPGLGRFPYAPAQPQASAGSNRFVRRFCGKFQGWRDALSLSSRRVTQRPRPQIQKLTRVIACPRAWRYERAWLGTP